MKNTNATAAVLAALMMAVLLTGCSGAAKAEMPEFTRTPTALPTRDSHPRSAPEAPGYTLVKLSQLQPPAGQELKENAFTGFVTSRKDLNIREEARATSALVGTLPRGSKVEVKATVLENGKSTGWYQIDYNGKTAYVAAMYVGKEDPNAAQTGTANAFTGYVVSAGDLNVREEARATSRLLGTLPRGNRVEVKSTVQENGRDTGWYQIDYNGKTAYVAAMYVSKTAPTAQPVQKDTAFTGYVTSAGELNVREQPRATSRRLGGLPTGSKVEVKAAVQENGRDTGWYQIAYNGNTAYVAAMYVSKTAPTSLQTGKANAFTGYVTSAGDLNVREQPRATSRRLGTLPRGGKVEVKATVQENGRDTGWYQIDYDGKTAYVAAMYVSETAPVSLQSGKANAFTGYVTSVQDLNVREQPRVSAQCVGRLPHGSSVEVKATVQENGRDTGWYQISYEGKTAYVAAMYVGKTAPAAQLSVKANAFTGYVISVGDLNVRSEPRADAQKLGAIPRGTAVNVRGNVQRSGTDTGWYQITYNGKTAYVACAYISKIKPSR